MSDKLTCDEPFQKTEWGTPVWAFSFDLSLSDTQSIASVDAISIDNATTPALTTGSLAVASAPFKNEKGKVIEGNRAAQAQVSGGKHDSNYILHVQVTLNDGTRLGGRWPVVVRGAV